MSENDNQLTKAALEKAALEEAAWEKANMEIAAREEAEWKEETLMKSALEGGRAVYHADLHYKLGIALCDSYLESLFQKKGDLDGAIAEFREAVRLNSNNALAQNHLRLALSWRDHPARPEEGKFTDGYEPGTPEFEELGFDSPADPVPIWPAAEQSIREVYREQAGREPTGQELAMLKERITGVPSQRDVLSAAFEAGKQAYREAKDAVAAGDSIQQGEHVVLANKPTKGDAKKAKKTPKEEIHEIYAFIREVRWFCIIMCILWVLGWLIAKF